MRVKAPTSMRTLGGIALLVSLSLALNASNPLTHKALMQKVYGVPNSILHNPNSWPKSLKETPSRALLGAGGLNQGGFGESGLSENGFNENLLNQNGLSENRFNQNALNENGFNPLSEDDNEIALSQRDRGASVELHSDEKGFLRASKEEAARDAKATSSRDKAIAKTSPILATSSRHAKLLRDRIRENNQRIKKSIKANNLRLAKSLQQTNARLRRQLEADNAKARATWDRTTENIVDYQVRLHEQHLADEQLLDRLDRGAKRGSPLRTAEHPSEADIYAAYYEMAKDRALTPPRYAFMHGIDGLQTPNFDSYQATFPLIMYSPSHLPLLAKRLRIPPAMLPPPFGLTFVANGFHEIDKIKKLKLEGAIGIDAPAMSLGLLKLPGGGAHLNIDKVDIDTARSRVIIDNKFLGGQFDFDILPFMGFNIMGGYIENLVHTSVIGARFTLSGTAGAGGKIMGMDVNAKLQEFLSHYVKNPDDKTKTPVLGTIGNIIAPIIGGLLPPGTPPALKNWVTNLVKKGMAPAELNGILKLVGVSLSGGPNSVSCNMVGNKGKKYCQMVLKKVAVALDKIPINIESDTRGYIIGGGPNFKFGYKGFFTMLNLMMLYISLDEYKANGEVTRGFVSKPVFVYYPRIGYNYKPFSFYVGMYGYKLIGTTKGKGNPLPPAVAEVMQLNSFGVVLDNDPIAYTLGIGCNVTRNWFLSGEYQISSSKQGWNLAIGARF